MKSLLKRSLSILVVLVLVLSTISGCSKKTTTEQVTNDPQVTQAAQATPTGTEETQGGEVILEDPKQPEELGTGDVKWAETETTDGYVLVTNEGGKTLGYSKNSGVKLIQLDGFAFKDLTKNGLLDQYEDWRLDVNTRAASLASLMQAKDIAGLMLYSAHQMNITDTVSDDQKVFLDTGLRAVLNAASSSPTDTQAKWSNAMQAYVEGKDFGIPVNFSTDPRTSGVSVWPSNLGLAATFDPSVAQEAAKTSKVEYRNLGIGTLLGPQIDIASEPRWARVSGTFGEDPALSRDMTSAYTNGIQSTYDENGNDLGWGEQSMNAMIKHWPGDGAAEGGRESHAAVGEFQVYPGGQFQTHLIPFVDGGLNLDGKTESASAVMASYSIAWSEDGSLGELVGSGYSDYKMNLLRETYGFDGVICTDWNIVFTKEDTGFMGTCWGVEDLTIAERVYKAIMLGVDQFGGVNDAKYVMDAYDLGVADNDEDTMNKRFQESAVRLLKNYFQIGLFENPYVDVTKANETVGNSEFVEAGYQAQLKSIVMLKNSNNTLKAAESTDKPTVYIPMVFTPASQSSFGASPASWSLPVDMKEASEYFNVVTDSISEKLTGPKGDDGNPTIAEGDIVRASASDLANCDFALAIISSPSNPGNMISGYGFDDVTGTYIPMTLQYGKYTANSASVRQESIAGNMVEKEVDSTYGTQKIEEKENRSYFGNSTTATNKSDLDTVLYAADNMPENAGVIVAIKDSNPMVFSEFESKVDAIILGFGVSNKAFLEVVAGKYEPSGLLPFQMPNDMSTVEAQFEDVPRDMECYLDGNGNTYDFAYGLNWSGVIQDDRTTKYAVPALVTPENTGK